MQLRLGVALVSLVVALVSASPPKSDVLNRGEEKPFIHVPLAPTDDYKSGKVHEMLMEKMMAAVDKMRGVNSAGIFEPREGIKPIAQFTPCVDGYAGKEVNNTYACRNLDLYSFTPHADMGSTDRVGSDVWGWAHTSDGGVTREFGLVAQMDGTAFVEVLANGQIAYLGRLATQTVSSIWRDIKVIGNYAYIGSEAEGHGIQVFDLLKLLDVSLVKSPKNFSIHTDLTAHYDELPIGRSHNVVAHAAKNLIVAVGSVPRTDICAAGLIFIDVTDPSSPKSAGCAAADGYVHDAQCLIYYGPHTKYNGTDVCYSFNEDSFTIYNVSDPAEPFIISTTSYYGVSYSHQGWVIDEKNQTHLLLNDEDDEVESRGWAEDQKTVTYIWDITDLEHPVLTGYYKSPAVSIDHNLYVLNGLCYESNYNSGLRVVNVSSVTKDPTGAGFFEAAFFDVHPEDDDVNGVAEYGGAWSVYPYFESGYLIVNTLERGLFVLKYAGST
ncbi:hypothetical protein DFH08DRAFT_833829 [Mycena albidolilacea]|uniref:Regulatory P domain-containing protein n=1 Tax=Mycena albidolilacea TaxID=1033008 RepID=A0AAD7ARM4_9AGAR|nr:hypothetical protein DFH08DRAFT_833829 [Mycena albidolilacea]